ncbi:Uncharacterised protein [uncultured Comamonas sp.]|nr:Uncharacterised protein [uncultured Comamonas sp.]
MFLCLKSFIHQWKQLFFLKPGVPSVRPTG